MFILSSFLLVFIVVAENNPSQEYFNNNNEFTNDEETPYCGKINMNAEDITYEVLDDDEDIVELKWTDAFKKDNLEKFTIAGCVVEVVIKYGCKSVEACCQGGGNTTINSTSTIFPANTTDPVQITACGDKRYFCFKYKGKEDTEWVFGGKRLDTLPLPPCKEFCEKKTWEEYRNMFEDYKVEEIINNNTGQYELDWVTNLHGYEKCLSDVILYYNGTHLPDDFPDNFKCSKGFKNGSVKEYPNKVDSYICGDITDFCMEFKKGDNKFTRTLKLKEVPECAEESSLGSNIGFVIGIIICVVIIFLLFFWLFRYDLRCGLCGEKAESEPVSS